MSDRGRFAPSPTGTLHFGSLVAALGSWLRARAIGAEWFVRIEDIDPLREVPGAAEAIVRQLLAFGLVPDGPVLRQSADRDRHAAARDRLLAAGLAYRCACSRADLAPYGGRHPARCIAPPPTADRPAAVRLRVQPGIVRFVDAVQGPIEQDVAAEVGDFVIWRNDGWPAYQLAVVVDDAAQGVTEVVRGADLLDSTPRQCLLQRLLGLPQPAWMHLPLVLDADGRKLGKRDRAHPVDPADPLPALRAALRFLGQAVPDGEDLHGLLAAAAHAFDPARIPRGTPPAPGRDATQREVS
ncbi:MAG: tRNA glutamyl-Q(34) synthetase GluQRS [Rhodanobacter denitrificans]|uniref:Glutamyl-Q tRNA(Asp) synthetase n=1 Tax=Rhodanobacter denitrificans TaxID=666685 RepID=A0A2W5JY58_9GAMM|nr:MAG: tRNA glutamyl-Q(34) synthetase GluQRS [Rhodanobacter denitrificans]